MSVTYPEARQARSAKLQERCTDCQVLVLFSLHAAIGSNCTSFCHQHDKGALQNAMGTSIPPEASVIEKLKTALQEETVQKVKGLHSP